MISSVGPTRSSTFYAYLVTKIGNRNLNFTEEIRRAHLLLLQPSIRPIPAQVIYCGKGRQNFVSNVTLYPASVPTKTTWLVILKKFFLNMEILDAEGNVANV